MTGRRVTQRNPRPSSSGWMRGAPYQLNPTPSLFHPTALLCRRPGGSFAKRGSGHKPDETATVLCFFASVRNAQTLSRRPLSKLFRAIEVRLKKTSLFIIRFYIKTIILPRRARDTHGEAHSKRERAAFSCSGVITFGADGDSFYEYLLRCSTLLPRFQLMFHMSAQNEATTQFESDRLLYEC